jgi:hypothetical protein
MIRLAALPALFLAAAVSAAPGGRLGTLPVGEYRCELPGDASGPGRRPVPDENFSIRNASSYSTSEGAGSYLLTGDRLIMTSGPRRGASYRRLSDNFLRKLTAEGEESPLRCVRRLKLGG